MWSTKEFLIFFAGAAALHTLSHIALYMLIQLPMQFGPINLTPQLNNYVIVISAFITAGLIWWANSVK